MFPQNLPNGKWNINRLYDLIKYEREDEFLQALEQIALDPQNINEIFAASKGTEKLLTKAIEKDLIRIVEKVAEMCFVSEKNAIALLKYACSQGRWKSLDVLLKLNIISMPPLLPIVVRNFGQKTTESFDFEKCFEILLNNPNIDVNQFDTTKKCALHYAIQQNHSNAILKLLKKEAYIGVKDEFNHFSISHINPKLLESHFDSCITTNGLLANDKNFEIQFDFKNLVRAKTTHNVYQADALTTIEHISKSKNLKHLIVHPLISGFLSLKWNRLAPFFYINFLFCTLFAVVSITYILVFYNQNTRQSMNKGCLSINDSFAASQVNEVFSIARSIFYEKSH